VSRNQSPIEKRTKIPIREILVQKRKRKKKKKEINFLIGNGIFILFYVERSGARAARAKAAPIDPGSILTDPPETLTLLELSCEGPWNRERCGKGYLIPLD